MLIMRIEKDGDVIFRAPIRTLFSLLDFRGTAQLPRPYQITVLNSKGNKIAVETVGVDDEV